MVYDDDDDHDDDDYENYDYDYYGDDDFDAEAGQQADGGVVDLGVEDLLGAAGQEGDAAFFGAFGGVDAGAVEVAAGGDRLGGEGEHGAQALGEHGLAGDQFSERAGELGGHEGGAHAVWVGQDFGQGGAQEAFGPGAFVGGLDVVPGVVDQVHVVHAAGAGGHAGEA